MKGKIINGLTREEAMNKAFKIGFEGESNRSMCSQETFHAISSVLGVKNPIIFKCLSALEGGCAVTTKGTCGSFSGALVAFSFFFGRNYKQWEKAEVYQKSTILGQKLYKKFFNKYGTIICREMHKKIFGRTFDLMDEKNLGIDMEELKVFEEMEGHTIKCPTVVGLTAAWALDLLWDEISEDKDISEIIDLKNAEENLKFNK
jgi:C_GCAxxG_C_C family probable redox protein